MRKEGLPLQRLLGGDALVTLAKDLRYADVTALYAAVGENHVSAQSVVQKLVAALGGAEGAVEDIAETAIPTRRPQPPPRRAGDPGVVVKGVADVWVKLAKCCTPVPGDDILGFVTRGGGVSRAPHRLHQRRRPAEPSRSGWSRSSGRRRPARCSSSRSRSRRSTGTGCSPTSPGRCPTSASTSCPRRCTTTRDRVAVSRFTFELADPTHLGHLLQTVRHVEGVYDVYARHRLTPRPAESSSPRARRRAGRPA